MEIQLNNLERFLACGISDDSNWHAAELKGLWESIGDEKAWDFAVKNGAESIVGNALSSILGVDLPGRWSEAMMAIDSRLSLYMEQLDRVAAALFEHDIQLVALKNSGIARGIYPMLSGNPMGDIDVLVSKQRFREAHEILTNLGFKLDSRSPLGEETLEDAEKAGGSEYTILLTNGQELWFELQWRPVAGRWINEDQEPSPEELIDHSVEIAGSRVRLLSPNDNLLQVSLHTAKHSYIRAPGFRLHTDVDRIVRRCEIEWEPFVAKVRDLGVCTAVYFSLMLAKKLLKTPIPQGVLEKLKPGALQHWAVMKLIIKGGLFNPDEHKWNRIEYILFNLFLYDNLRNVSRSVFPSRKWMLAKYGNHAAWLSPFFYCHRIFELLLLRAKT